MATLLRIIGLTLVAFIIAAALSPANASLCGARDQMVKVLIDKYQETPRGLGVVSEQNIVELYTSPSGTRC